MRIVLVSDAYPPMIGGATRAAQQLGRQLTIRGHDVTVATAWQRDLPALEDDAGVEVHRLPGVVSRVPALSADPVRYTPPPFPDPEIVARLRRLVRAVRPDVVHSYGWLTYSCAAALARRPEPLLLSAREYANVCPVRTLVRQGRHRGSLCSGPAPAKCTECAGAFYGQPKGAVAVAGVLQGRRLIRRRMHGLHSTSRFTQDALRRHLPTPAGIPDVVIPDFREDHLTGPPDEGILARLPDRPYILFVGSFRRIKGDTALLEAYAQLEDPPPLVMIGARSMESIPDFPTGVTALFDVPHDTVMAAWDRALFGVAPSVVPEALGNVVHEGMSRGKAVVGTRPGGHADMIVDGETGLLIPAGDVAALTGALERLIAEPDLVARMGAAARERAEIFTVGATVPRFEELYGATIAAAGARRAQRHSNR